MEKPERSIPEMSEAEETLETELVLGQDYEMPSYDPDYIDYGIDDDTVWDMDLEGEAYAQLEYIASGRAANDYLSETGQQEESDEEDEAGWSIDQEIDIEWKKEELRQLEIERTEDLEVQEKEHEEISKAREYGAVQEGGFLPGDF